MEPADRETARSIEGNSDGLPAGVQRWGLACLALKIAATTGGDVGGIRVTSRHGPILSIWLSMLGEVASVDRTRTIPANVTEDRLTGAIDLAATLAAGRRTEQPGLLAGLGGDGVAIMQGYERTDAGVRGLVAQAWDQSGFLLIAIDGAEVDDADREAALRLRPGAIDDRAGLWIDLDGIALADAGFSAIEVVTSGPLWDNVQAAKAASQRYPRVTIDDAIIEEVCQIASVLGVVSLRAVSATVAAARAIAAMDDRASVTSEDVTAVLPISLLPRATQMPAPPAEADDEEQREPDPPDADAEPPAQSPETSSEIIPLDDQLIEAAAASLPADLLAALAAANAAPTAGAGGASGAMKKRGRKGRRFGARHGAPAGDKKLNLIETLRAAAPWQPIRKRAAAQRPGGAPEHLRVHVRKSDFRVYRQKERAESLAVFVVDASGSSAVQRFAEAKGAIELLLGESYARRDHVAMVAVRGQHAEVLLPPTRSLTRAKRVLSALPGGGGTPLASGLDAGLEVALGAAHRGQSPMIVLLTDGQANIARDGSHGRKSASADAQDAARAVQASGLPAIVLDTSNRPQARAAEIATAMGARYLPLPRANADELARTVADVAEQTREERIA